MSLCRLCLISAVLLVGGDCLAANEIEVEYRFEQPSVEAITVGTETYHRVTMRDAPASGAVGHPALPARGAEILLPPGTRVASIKVRKGSRTGLGRGFIVEPVQQPSALSADPASRVRTAPDPASYAADHFGPEQVYEEIGVQSFRGYSIQILKLHPVTYKPSTGELRWYDRLTVVIELVEDDRKGQSRRGLKRDLRAVRARVDKPELADIYETTAEEREAAFDLLILTVPELVDSFEPLAAYHTATGTATEIHTTVDAGGNDPATVRDYIRDRYMQDGIEYVLIGGDDDLIPARDLYVQAWPTGLVVADMPGDIYFACLDGTYNYDGDSRWGEPTDGVDGGEIDLIAEVYVGRACVGNSLEAELFVTKTLAYLSSSHEYLGRVLMAGETIGLGDLAQYAGNSLDEIINSSSSYGYWTAGIPADRFTVDKLYDRDGSWSSSEIASRINDGRHIVNHYGHSNVNYAMKMTSSVVPLLLANPNPCFIYSQGCLAGHFDGMDCWAETMNIKTDRGAFALIMNARQGWGTYSTTDGPSQRYNREFWDAVFNPVEGKPELGRAHHDSKEDNLYRINEACMRWCYYETTLFGDPTVQFRTIRTIAFEFGAAPPETVEPGQPRSLIVTVRGVGEGVPLPGTGRLHLSLNGGPYVTTDLTEISPNQYQIDLPALFCGDRLAFYVSAEEETIGRVYESAPGRDHAVLPGGDEVTVFSDDFETDRGWLVSGGLWQRGTPQGGGGNAAAGPDPAEAVSGTNVFGYNLWGNYEANLGPMHLTSPPINCANLTDVTLKFQRWLGVETPPYDHASLQISTNGTDWTSAWESLSEIWDAAWNQINLDISALADLEPTVFVRFTMGPTDAGLEYCGWNIDDVEITGHECDDLGDADNDGIVNVDDNCPLVANPDQLDADDDGHGALCDCDDTNPEINPESVWYRDSDMDTFGDPETAIVQCEPPVGYVLTDQDCDDTDSLVNPNTVWYADYDGDGYGTAVSTITMCEAPPGYARSCCDNCPDVSNPSQSDVDADGEGDSCDACTDGDDDGWGDPGFPSNTCATDNCPSTANPGQEDADADGTGDACCCIGRVGNVNQAGGDEPTIGDVSVLIDNLFISGAILPCLLEADVNQSGGADPAGGDITIGDISTLIDYLFITGSSLGLADCL